MNRLNIFVLLVWVALAGGLAANAQPVTTLYSFVRGPINPHAGLTLGNDGNFYGTTTAGGRNLGGTVFRLTTNGVLTTLFSFNGYPSGSGPTADLTLGPGGNFYGTTTAGGTTLTGVNTTGVVFKMSTNGIPTTLVNFNGTNGGHPDAALTLGPDGYYYGTTEFSGSNNVGTVFKVTTSGTLITLVTFNNTNGANPVSTLTLAPGGTFYGTTKFGGNYGLGTAFKLTTNGDFTMLNNFDQTNGAWPAGRMALGPDGNLYGTTAYLGTAFEMTTNGVVTTLVNFSTLSTTNGEFPYSGLTLGPDGNFYGTTSQGGANGSGTIFQVSTNGTLAMLANMPGVQVQFITNSMGVVYYTTNNFATIAPFLNGALTTLYSFSALVNSDNGDGADPESDLTLGPDGNFYGTTVGGGTNGAGAVFKISTNGAFTALASFAGNTGYNPYAGVTAGPGGSLYGVVKSGGTTGYGTAYKVTSTGQFTLLNNFSYFPDGANPQATLIQGPDGNFYGTAVGGGTNLLQTGPSSFQAESFGTVFELATNGALTMLAYFNGTNGANPYGDLAFGLDGNFYGTTAYGGISNNGVVFRLLTNGTLTALTNFTGANGANPYEGLTLGLDNNFYGTTEAGGSNNDGTVFQVTPAGALTTLVYFNGTNGANPNDGLTLGLDGNLYGTTYTGGAGFGTVFKVTTGGAFTTLYTFAQTNFGYPHGEYPVGGLTQGPDGCLYGTTSLGGVNNFQGTLFKITTDGTLTTLYSFAIPNGSFPFATLTLQTNSHFINFYGTTLGDGGDHPGSVFRVNLTTSYAIAENTMETFSPLTNETVWTTGGALGLLTAVATNGTANISGSGIVFTPTTNFTGTATISYTVTDNAGGTNASFITILVTNIPPVANPDVYTVAENSSANVLSPLANDQFNTSGGILGLVSVSPTNGTAAISGTNVLFTPQTNFTGTATIGYTITDSVGGTNSSLITVTVASASADLSLSASAAPEPVGVGSNLVYAIVVTNQGPSAATGVVVSNRVPASVNFVSATGGSTPSGGILFVNLDSLAANATTNVQVTVQPNSAGKLTNLFQVFANETDPVLTNNSATVVSTVTNVPVGAPADLSLSVSVGPQYLQIYSNIVYTITVSNAGPSTATGVVVSNQIPTKDGLPSLNFISASDGSTPTDGILLMSIGSLAVGATDSIQISGLITTNLYRFNGAPASAWFTNVFQVFADQTDPVPTNNTDVVVSQWADGTTIYTTSTWTIETNLTATVSQQATNFSTELIARLPNGTVVYDQTFNAAYSDPTVQAAVTLAAGDLTGAGATSYTGPTQTSFLQNLESSSSVAVTNIIGTDTSFATSLYIGPQTIMVSANQSEPYFVAAGQQDFDTLVTAVVTNLVTTTNTSIYTNWSVYAMTGMVAQADLSLSAGAAPEPVTVGSNLVYSFSITNQGPNAASGVTVSNRIPANVSFISATGGAMPTSGVLLLNLGSLATGAVTNAQVIVQPTTAGKLTNLFAVFANETDPVPTNNSATVVSTVTNPPSVLADLGLSANVLPEPVIIGSNLVYTIAITNRGPSAATGVVVSNRVPANETFVSATGGSTPSGGILLVNLGSLAAGAANSAQIIVQPSVAGKLTNLFQVFASQTDPVLTNNSAAVISTVTNGPALPVDVALSLTAAPNPVDVGAPLTYSLTVTNNSLTPATGVVVSNALPPNVSVISVLPSQGAATNQSGLVTYTVGSLPNGIAATLAIVVVPNAVGWLTNSALTFSAQTDSQPANNRVTNVTSAVSTPITNLVLTVLSSITLNPKTGLFEQQIEVSNGGPSTPSSVRVLISGLAANVQLYNASGITNGIPYVQSSSPLGVGSNVVFLLEYYVPTRVAPANLTQTVQAGPLVIPPVVSGTVVNISRTVVLANGSVLVEFNAVPGQIYAIQYSSDLTTWQTAVPVITAPANRVQWIDAGPPKTDSNPAQQTARYYRVILLTAH